MNNVLVQMLLIINADPKRVRVAWIHKICQGMSRGGGGGGVGFFVKILYRGESVPIYLKNLVPSRHIRPPLACQRNVIPVGFCWQADDDVIFQGGGTHSPPPPPTCDQDHFVNFSFFSFRNLTDDPRESWIKK